MRRRLVIRCFLLGVLVCAAALAARWLLVRAPGRSAVPRLAELEFKAGIAKERRHD